MKNRFLNCVLFFSALSASGFALPGTTFMAYDQVGGWVSSLQSVCSGHASRLAAGANSSGNEPHKAFCGTAYINGVNEAIYTVVVTKADGAWVQTLLYEAGQRQCPEGQSPDPVTGKCGLGKENGGGSCEQVGNPINHLTGNKFQRFLDIVPFGGSTLKFERFYNSQYDNVSFFGGIGHHWSHSFQETIIYSGDEFNDPPVAEYATADGKSMYFTLNPAGDWEGKYAASLSSQVDANGDIISWTLMQGSVTKQFDEQGRLVLVTNNDRNSEFVLTYDSDGLLSRIEDENGVSYDFFYNNAQLLSEVVTSDGKSYKYHYLSNFMLDKVDYPDGTSEEYKYESQYGSDLLTALVDRSGHRFAEWGYDSSRRAIYSQHLDNNQNVVEKFQVDYTYVEDPNDPRVTVTNPLNKETTYHFQNVAGPRKIISVEGHASSGCAAANKSYTYDANGFKDEVTDWAGNVTDFDYNANGFETTRVEAKGSPVERTIVTEWNESLGLKTLERVVGDHETAYSYYTGTNRIQQVTVKDLTQHTQPYTTYGRTHTWNYTYTYWDPGTDTKLKSITVDGPRSGVSDTRLIEYNQLGLLTKVTNALGQTTEVVSYDASGRPLETVDENGITTTYAYTPQGSIDSTTIDVGGINATTRYQYDAVGQLEKLTSPTGRTVNYAYDGARRLQKITDSFGNYIQYTRDAAGNVTKEEVFDKNFVLKREINKQFDELSRIKGISSALAIQEAQYGYDVNSNQTDSVQGSNNPVTRLYDALDRLSQINHADGGVSYYEYDHSDHLTKVTDQNGLITSYTYDGFGYLIQQVSPDSGTSTYWYDEAGNRTESQDARGVVRQYQYDALNRLTGVTFPASSAENIQYFYDDTANGNVGVGRLTSFSDQSGSTQYTYNAIGQVQSKTVSVSGNLYQWRYSYDLAGNLERIRSPSGRLIKYTLDVEGRVITVAVAEPNSTSFSPLATNIKYLPFGPMQELTFGNGIIRSLAYNLDYRLVGLTSQGSSQIINWSYQYFDTGNISTWSDSLTPSSTQTFQYDDENRLVTAGGDYGNIDYDYDPVGNRTAREVDFDKDSVIDLEDLYEYTINGVQVNNRLHKIVRNSSENFIFGYDSTGSLLTHPINGRTYTYNDAGRMSDASSTSVAASYLYNALGQQVSKISSPGLVEHHFHYNARGQLIAQSHALTGLMQREYVYVGDSLISVIVEDSDDDGMADDWEESAFGDLSRDGNGDYDSDGFSDVDEYMANTFADNAGSYPGSLVDQDSDSLSDEWEIHYFGDLSQDGSADFDGDGISNLNEFLAGTNPAVAEDVDFDGLPDHYEVSVFGGLSNSAYGDFDGDGYSNIAEMEAGTSPVNALSAPGLSDSDSDGLPDSWELADFGSLRYTASDDYDGDHVSNLNEYLNHTDPAVSSDTDADGMPDNLEYAYFSDLVKAGLDDTDSDGLSDKVEISRHRNPIVNDNGPIMPLPVRVTLTTTSPLLQ